MRITAVLISGLLGAGLSHVVAQTPSSEALRPPAAFEGISDPAEQSRAIFTEIGKVLTHPRCMNCHPAGDRPLQGADHHEHFPPARRNAACVECHTVRNFTLQEKASYQSIPGHPRWDLAPLSMAWQGKSLREICIQLKDKDRNGGRDLALLQEHVAKDDLVAWGWDPGKGREPAPGSQEHREQVQQILKLMRCYSITSSARKIAQKLMVLSRRSCRFRESAMLNAATRSE